MPMDRDVGGAEPVGAHLRWFWPIFAAICLGALLLRLPTLGSRSLWLDETYSAWFARLPLHELWVDVPKYETHPPFYYSLLKAWSALVGSSEAGLRSLSVLASVATVAVVGLSARVMRTGREIERVALIAALALSFNAGHIRYAQQARPYALETLAATLALLFAVELMRRLRTTAALPIRRIVAPALGLACSTAATMWLHDTGVLVGFGLWLGMFLSLIAASRAVVARAFAVLVASGVLALLLWSPFLPTLLHQTSNVGHMTFWVKARLVDAGSAWMLLTGAGFTLLAIELSLAALALLVLMLRARALAIQSAVVLLVPLAAVLLVHFFVKPIFIDRLFEWMAPLLMALVAYGLVCLPTRLLRATGVVVILALSMKADVRYFDTPTENWRAVTDLIRAQAQPGDLVVTVPNELNLPFAYYTRGTPFPETLFMPAPFPALGRSTRYVGNLGAPAIVEADLPMLRRQLDGHQRIWLVGRLAGLYDPTGLVMAEIAHGRKRVVDRTLTGVDILRFE